MSDLLSKIKKTLGTGVDVIGTKSKELWDSTVIRTRIADLRSRRRGLAEQLGGMVYTMLMEDNIDLDAIKAKAAEISEVDADIDRAEEELAQVGREAQEKKTEHAGPSEEQAQSQSQAEPQPQAQPEPLPAPQPEPVAVRRCECGAEARTGARYCVECGRPIPPTPAQ